MDRFCTDYTLFSAFESYRFAYNHAGVDSTNRIKADQTTFFNIGYDEANLIHMCGKHQLVFRSLFSFFLADEVSSCVCICGAVSRKVRFDPLSNFSLTARYTIDCTKFF